MADQYVSELLRISIAQICQTIGYNAIQTTPLELLQDNLHKFLHEFCRDLRRHVEHYNRNDANLDDVCLTLASLNIKVNELLEYILNVQPVTFAIDVPKFPVRKESNLNFLKPGSREVLIRPVHIYEHLPPILPPDDYPSESSIYNYSLVHQSCSSNLMQSSSEDALVGHIVEVKSDHNLTNIDGSILKQEYDAKTNARMLDEEGRPTREIGSVMMTTGGFISPAIEGKLPDTRIPDIIDILEGLDAPPPPPPQRSITTSRSSSRTSVATPTPAPTSTSTAHQKLGSEEKSMAPSNGPFEKSVTPEMHTAQTKQHISAGASPGGISNASSSVITAAAAMRLAKKHVSVQQSALPPPLAARILKKAKKKSAMMPFSASNKVGRSGFSSSAQDPSATSLSDMPDKSQRKRMKMLQKLVKSAKSTSGEIPCFGDTTGKIKNLHGLFNPTLLDSMPSGSKRLQMEKMLKRQAKHKQKLLKAQMAIQFHDKPQEQQQELEQQQPTKGPLLESQKAPSSKIVTSTKHLPNFMPSIQHHSEKKNAKSPNNSGVMSTASKKARKSSPVTTQNFLNSIPGYRSLNALKTASIAAPVFGEAPFSNEPSFKDPPELKTPEVKLSTEPDRSKLNIFKKISSKQKIVHRTLSPTTDATVATQIFSGNDNQVINLPSGTTITPAPPTSGRHVYAPHDASIITVEDSNKTHNTEDTSLSVTQSSTTTSYFGKAALLTESESPDAIHKPKKRGRKPGSKNQPKVAGLGPSPGVSPKKPKKIKMQKNLYGPPFQLHAEQRSEPLNLSHSFSARSDMNSNIPLGIASTYPILDQSVLQKEITDRKKLKIKDSPVQLVDSLGATPLGMHHNPRESSTKKSLLSPFSGPTKEEVDSINRKLLKMDTVLQPAPPLQQLPLAHGPGSSVSKEMIMSPTKSVINTSPGTKHRSLYPRNPAGNFGVSGSPLEGTISGPMKSFPNLPPNLLPMLPMYSFTPRPGLIPTPGLFPSVLGNFPNKQTNPTTNMLLQGLLPFPNLTPSSSGLLRSPGMKISDKMDNVAMMEPSGAERNYCNVAPLVPESVKQKLSSPGAAGTSLISPKHTSLGERELPKTPQLKHSPTISETIRESLQQKFAGLGTPDSRSLGSKSIPSTPGGISLNTFDCLMRGSSSISTNSTPNNSIGVPDALRSRALSRSSDNLKNIPNIPTLHVDSPIEVSDDSEDASASTMTSKLKGSSSVSGAKHRAQLKPPTLPAPLLSQMDDIFIPIDNTKNIGLNQQYLLPCRNKEVKKSKKQNKNCVKNSLNMSPATSVEFCVSKIGGDTGVGKLAGGADLIPLSATGLAYSSKTTPTNSLTASTNREFGSSEVLGGDLSVTPSSSDAHDKRSKKLKKIKYGKIKKKKDKKDKTKNKEKYEKIEKRTKEKDPEKQRDKDTLKKIKKDKKREKQRSTRESLSSPTSVTAPNPNLTSACFDMNSMNLSNIPTFPNTTPPINTTTSSVVPKLTLKLGSCQSPTPFDDLKQRKQTHKPTSASAAAAAPTRESSPELARISPLVTRPPKQKSTSIDSSSHFNALGAVASSGSNSLGTFTTTDLFGDKNRSNNCMNRNISSSPIPPVPSSWSSGGTLTASSTLLPQQLLQSSITQHTHEEPPSISASSSEVASTTNRSNLIIHSPALVHETNRPSSYIDAEGNRVWICPACGKVDDGSAMIGCDGCDAWYHWVCVGIFVAPKDNEDWFCRVCIAKKKGMHGIDKKRKRNKKNKQ